MPGEFSKKIEDGHDQMTNIPMEKDCCYMHKMLSLCMAFTVQMNLEITEGFYLADLMRIPISIRVALNRIGKTSVQLLKNLEDVNGKTLASLQHTFVYVDRKTRRPSPHPREFVDKFGSVKPRVIFQDYSPPKKTTLVFTTSYTVRWSDCDLYYHSNQAQYLRYVLNAAAEACSAGALHKFQTRDLAMYRIRNVRMKYAGETLAGENLTISVWDDETVAGRIHCEIKNKENSVFFSAIDFYEEPVLLLDVKRMNERWKVGGIEVKRDLTEAFIQTNGFSWSDCNRKGAIDPWRVAQRIHDSNDKLMIWGQEYPSEDFAHLHSAFMENLGVTLQYNVHITEKIYRNKELLMFQPVVAKFYLNKVGRSSIQLLKNLEDVKGNLLASSQHSFVVIDKHTRLPVKHSTEYTKKFGHVQPRIEFDQYRIPMKRTSVFKTKYTVRWSDTDILYHNNQFSYIRYAMNAVEDACFAGALGSFQRRDLATYKVKNMMMLYLGETEALDFLDISVWEDEAMARRIHCAIEKEGKVVFATAVDFYEDNSLLNIVPLSQL